MVLSFLAEIGWWRNQYCTRRVLSIANHQQRSSILKNTIRWRKIIFFFEIFHVLQGQIKSPLWLRMTRGRKSHYIYSDHCHIIRLVEYTDHSKYPWWRDQVETLSALLALCARNSPVTGEFPSKRPVTRSFDVFLDLLMNKRLRKQSWGRGIETPSFSLWRHCNT